VRGGLAAAAAVEGIVGRRLQAGRGTEAAFTAIDRGIEQFGQRRPDRLHVGAMRLGFWGFAGLFRSVRVLRHGAQYRHKPAAWQRLGLCFDLAADRFWSANDVSGLFQAAEAQGNPDHSVGSSR
jgi:hypothetical protein